MKAVEMNSESGPRSWKNRLSPPGSLRSRSWRWLRKQGRRALGWQGPETLDLDTLRKGPQGQRWLIVSGCPGASRRYRVDHLQSYLQAAGACAAVLQADDARLSSQRSKILSSVDGLVFQRTRAERKLLALRDQAKSAGRITIYESDDLIFEDGVANLYLRKSDLRAHRAFLQGCDYGLTSSDELKKRMLVLGLKRVFVFRNGYSKELETLSEQARRPEKATEETFRLGYASGTPTHDQDFHVISDSLTKFLKDHPQARLSIIGPLTLTGGLLDAQSQIDREDLVDWRVLPERIAHWHLNLAPFTLDSPFNQAKSAVKFIEAALLGVPTLASPLPAYRRAAQLGGGLTLASTCEEWSNALERAVNDREGTALLGEQALETARQHFSPQQRQIEARELLRELGAKD